MPEEWTETDCAYLAGMIDADGHIIIQSNSSNRGRIRHTLEVGVTNTHRGILDHLADIWGGTVSVSRAKNAKWKDQGSIRWFGSSAALILAQIQSFLRIKAEQCQIALEFMDTVGAATDVVGGRRPLLSDDVWQRREELRTELRRLNARGTGVVVAPQAAPLTPHPPLICQWCGAEFASYQKLRKYCSNECNMKAGHQSYMDRHQIEKVCPDCGTTFTTWRKGQVYCSKQCGPHGRIDRSTYQPRAKREKPVKTCAICTTDFTPRRKEQTTCSPACGLKYRAARLVKQPEIKTCPDCGREFTARKGQTYCSPKCGPHGRNSTRGLEPSGVKH